MKTRLFLFLLMIAVLFSCTKDDAADSSEPQPSNFIIKAVDISAAPKINASGFIYKDQSGVPGDFLDILKSKGVNTVRLKLWVNPVDGYSGFNEVRSFSDQLKNKGFKTWLTVHYSDTWADPGRQEIPAAWTGFNINNLQDAVYNYTALVMQEMQPDYIQIGNEINSGFLHPLGDLNTNRSNFLSLLQSGIQAVRDQNTNTQIMIHYAGHEGANWFFNQLSGLDYDLIGISYYPLWHGRSIAQLEENLNSLNQDFNKEVVIAETAYPFTLGFNDYTNNIVGLESQLILPQYPASPIGQKYFVASILDLSVNNEGIIGFSYWGAELVAWDGEFSTEGSPWENQALFDFDGMALPVLDVFE